MTSIVSILALVLFATLCSSLNYSVVKQKYNASVQCRGVFAEVVFWQVAMDPSGTYDLALQIYANNQCKTCMGSFNGTKTLVNKCKPCLTALKPYLIEWRRRGCVECFALRNSDSCTQCTMNVVSSGLEQHCAIKYQVREQMAILHEYLFEQI